MDVNLNEVRELREKNREVSDLHRPHQAASNCPLDSWERNCACYRLFQYTYVSHIHRPCSVWFSYGCLQDDPIEQLAVEELKLEAQLRVWQQVKPDGICNTRLCSARARVQRRSHTLRYIRNDTHADTRAWYTHADHTHSQRTYACVHTRRYIHRLAPYMHT